MAGLAALLSFALSLLANYQDPWINADGSLYLRLAESFSKGVAIDELGHDQPFYAWLIYSVSALTTLTFKHAAWLIDAAFYGLLTAYFIRLCVCLRPQRDTALIAAAVILFYPPLNEYRSYIVRDFGFWALAIVGLYYWVDACKRDSIRGYLVAELAFIGCSLFRFEGVLLMALPILFALKAHGFGWKIWAAALLAGVALAAALYQVAAIAAVVDVYAENIVESWEEYGSLIAIYGEEVTRGYLEDYALLGLLTSLVAVFSAAFIEKFNIVYLLAFIWLLYGMGRQLSHRRFHPVLAFFAWSLLFTLTYFMFFRVLQGRHFILMFLPCLVLLAVALADRLAESGKPFVRMRLRTRMALGFVLLYLFVEGFISFGADQAHVRNAVEWSREKLTAQDPVLVNEPELAYEVTGAKNWEDVDDIVEHPEIARERMAGYDAAILSVSRKSAEWKQMILSVDTDEWAMESFENNKGDVIVVLKRRVDRDAQPKD